MNTTLFYQQATILDCALLDKRLGLMGNSFIVDFSLEGEVDDNGFIYDFSNAKKKVKEIVDRDFDHRLFVCTDDIEIIDDYGVVQYCYGQGQQIIEYRAPIEAFAIIDKCLYSLDQLGSFIEQRLVKEMPSNVNQIKLVLREEKIEEHTGYFNYTHGLKNHQGNCQRLFHGHRSTITVHLNGKRSTEMENYFLQTLFPLPIHFASWDNVQNKKEIVEILKINNPVGQFVNIPFVVIEYSSRQGVFQAKVPGDMVYFLQQESTIENLSYHFCNLIRSMAKKNDQLQVSLYEGIGKGASVTM